MSVFDLMVPVKELPPLQAKTTLSEVICKLTQGSIGSGWLEDPDAPRHLLGLISDEDLPRGLRPLDAKQWALLTVWIHVQRVRRCPWRHP